LTHLLTDFVATGLELRSHRLELALLLIKLNQGR
jgi:hypothetical protein